MPTNDDQQIAIASQEWRATLDALTDLVVLVDRRGRIRRVNRTAEIWGLGALREIPGRPFHEVLHPNCPDGRCYLLERWRRLEEDGELRGLLEQEVEDAHLGLRVRLTARRIEGVPAAPESPYAVLVLRDVTVHHHRRLALSRRDWLESMSHLVRGLAHEIGNPLAAMKTSVQVLAKNFDQFPREKKESYMLRIVDGANRIQAILDRVLRHQRWKIERRDPVPVRPVCDMVSALFAEDLRERRIDLTIDGADDGVLLLGDATAVEAVLAILVSNAADACREGGRVKISVFQEEREVRIEVHDNGCGIPAQDLERVFQPFFTTKPQGSGVGLSHAHHLMEQMGGRIEIKSAEHQGTLVTLVFEAG